MIICIIAQNGKTGLLNMIKKLAKNVNHTMEKIYEISEQVIPSPPMHPHCRCIIQRLKSIFAGEATDMKIDGADWYLKYKGKLPKYYIFIEDAYKLRRCCYVK